MSTIHELLERELLQLLELNASVGYEMEPSWPAPEVFERPRWRRFVAEPGSLEVRTERSKPYKGITALGGAPDLTKRVEHELEIVTPTDAVTITDVEGWTHGIGWSEHERLIVFFSWRTRP